MAVFEVRQKKKFVIYRKWRLEPATNKLDKGPNEAPGET